MLNRVGTGISIKQTTPTEVQENRSAKEQPQLPAVTTEQVVRLDAAQMKSDLQMFGSLQQARLIQAAERTRFASLLSCELKKYDVEISLEALNNLTLTIAKGGNTGLFTSIALSYATAKLAAGPPLSDGIGELLTSLAQNPDQAEEFMTQIISDPNFFPITSDQLTMISRLYAEPGGEQLVGKYLLDCIRQQYNPESKLPDIEAARQEGRAGEQFGTLIPRIFDFLDSQEPDQGPFKDWFQY